MVDSVLLPNGEQQFFDLNGEPLAGGLVHMYVPFTTTPKTTWVDQGETTPNTNPITLDALGRCIIWGNGIYRQLVTDSAGNLIWDQLTSDGGISDLQGQITTINGEITTIDGQIASLQAAIGKHTIFPVFKSPTSTTLTAAQSDSGTLFSANAAGGTLVITLPDITTLYVGWYIGLIMVTNQIVAQVNGGSSEHILYPNNQSALAVSPASATFELLIISFDGANYEVIDATPMTWLALGAVGFQKTVTASYTVISSDNGGTLLLSGGFFQVTFNLPTSYPAGFSLHITNGDALAGKRLLLGVQSLMLWPRQGLFIQAGNDGQWHIYGGPERWVLPSSTTFYVNGSGGSDLNDGLSAATALQHIQSAINLFTGGITDLGAGIDINGQSALIQVAAGTYTENLTVFGGIVGRNVFAIQGVVGHADAVKLITGAGGATGVMARDLGEVQLAWMEFSCGAGSNCLNASQGGVIDHGNCIFGDCTGGNMAVAQDGGFINIDGPISLSGNATNWIFAQGGGRLTLGGQTFTATQAIHFTGNFIGVTTGAIVKSNGTPCTFVNPGSVSGVSYNVAYNGVLELDGTVVPGSAGVTSTGGQVSP